MSQTVDRRKGRSSNSLSPGERIFAFYNRKIIVIFAESDFSCSGAAATPALNLLGVHRTWPTFQFSEWVCLLRVGQTLNWEGWWAWKMGLDSGAPACSLCPGRATLRWWQMFSHLKKFLEKKKIFFFYFFFKIYLLFI